jgi:CheY-like chemotaxis protein
MTDKILICADYEVPIDPATGICPQCKVVHDMQSTYLWPADKPLPVRKKRVLVVDDDVDERSALALSFRLRGFEVVEAEDGRIGVEQWRESYPVDYLVTDYQMPKKNGVVMCMDVREMMERWKDELPVKTRIVIVSSDPPKLPREIADIPVLQKPVRIEELLEKLGIE